MSGQDHSLEVWLDCDLGPACLVGTLAHDRGQIRFHYERTWLQDARAFALDPDLSLDDAPFFPKPELLQKNLRCSARLSISALYVMKLLQQDPVSGKPEVHFFARWANSFSLEQKLFQGYSDGYLKLFARQLVHLSCSSCFHCL